MVRANEIGLVLKKMKPNKTPGKGGIPSDFQGNT